ncbi:DNA repair protein RecO [Candidatus Gottesmanbacteria bacterium]|nr:DNA repair protein RecO [Candidatus Gottesmanbacteria bacterium]
MTSPGRVSLAHAIVLKRRNVGEADRILTIFSKEYGRMRVVAKGVRRVHSRRAPHLEIFSHATLVLHKGKTWESVSEVTPIDAFPVLRAYLPRVSAAYYLCELVDALLPERQEHRDIYTLLLGALTMLNDTVESDPVVVSEQFALELLRCLGYLARDRILPTGQIEPYIERIIEKHLRTPKILAQLSATI